MSGSHDQRSLEDRVAGLESKVDGLVRFKDQLIEALRFSLAEYLRLAEVNDRNIASKIADLYNALNEAKGP
jgi:hypothetical protein